MTTEFTFKEQQGAVRGIKQASGTMQSLYKEMEHYKKPNYLFLMEGEKKKRAIELSNIKSLKKTSRAYFPGGEKSFIASRQIKNSLLEENISLSIWMGATRCERPLFCCSCQVGKMWARAAAPAASRSVVEQGMRAVPGAVWGLHLQLSVSSFCLCCVSD